MQDHIAEGSSRPHSLPVRYGLRLVAATSLVTAALLAITSVAGLAVGVRGLYRPDPATLPAFVGQDAITLVIVLPLLLWSMLAARRGSLHGLLLWSAALFYIAYSYAFYALAPEFNSMYLAYLAIVAMSLYGCLYLVINTDAEAVARRLSPHTPTRPAGAFLMALPSALGLMWIAMIVAHLTNGAVPSRVNQVVWPMDLVVAFPAMFWGGLWLWRRQPLGYMVAAILLIKGALLGVTLVVNTWLASTFWGVAMDPALPIYAFGGLGGLALAVHYLRQLRTWPAANNVAPDTTRAEAVHSGAGS